MNDPPLKGWPRLRDLVTSLCRPNFPLIGAEIGVSQGWTSEALLREFPSLILTMVDFWDSSPANSEYAKSGDSMARLTVPEQEWKMRLAANRTKFAGNRRRLIRSDSVRAARDIPEGWLDFAFIDASHLYESVKADAEAWATKVRPGGLLVGHDYRHPRDKRGLWGVERAWREFCEAKGMVLNGDERATICWCSK